MKRYFLFVPALFIASLFITSCEDTSDSNSPFGNLSPAGITGVKTTNTEEFCCWEAGPKIRFNATNTSYNYWNLEILDANGYFTQINNDPLHWRGKVEYVEKKKDKYDKDKYYETVYLDSMILDIATSEAGWGEGIFRIGSTSYQKGSAHIQPIMTTYYIRPEGGNFNTLNISDANHTYIFRFKTRTTDDINSWKMDQMPDGWMNSNGKISMLMLPVLYSMFQ